MATGVKNCESCGMPMQDTKDHGGGRSCEFQRAS